MKGIFLKLKQRFCKHTSQKVAIVRIETILADHRYITKVETKEVFECTKCKKRTIYDFPYASGTRIYPNR